MKKKMLSIGCLLMFLLALLFWGKQSASMVEISVVRNQNEIKAFYLEDRDEDRQRMLDKDRDTEEYLCCLKLLEHISDNNPSGDYRYTITVFYEDKSVESRIYGFSEDDGKAEVLRELLHTEWISL